MSDLQIILILIGALIIVAVIIVNWWQEKRFHQQIERSFSPLESDALLDEPNIDVSKLEATNFNNTKFDNTKFESTDFNAANFEATNEFSATNNARLADFTIDSIQAAPTIDNQNNHLKDQVSVNYIPNADDAEHFIEHTQYESDAEKLADSLSIDAQFPQRSNHIYSDLAQDKQDVNLDRSFEPAADIKPSQHNDIKAIFNEAFSQSAKIADAHENTPVAGPFIDEASLPDLKSNEPALDIEAGDNQPTYKEPQPSADILELSLPAMLNGHIDLTAVLYLASETSLSNLSNSLLGLFDDFDKPVFVNILIAQPELRKQWILLKTISENKQDAQQKVSRVACSLQLADRAGPVARNVLNRFQLAVETFGLDINAHVEWQSSGDALALASDLDAFCLDVDKSIGFHLIHGENGAFTGTKLRGLAEAQGFILDADGSFKYFLELEKPSVNYQQPTFSFAMFNRDNHPFSPEMLRISVVKSITFQLDITHIKQSSEAFTQMVQVAKRMESSLNAVLVDDKNNVLSDSQIEKIHHQLKVIHAKMLTRGITPGSDCALRLFS